MSWISERELDVLEAAVRDAEGQSSAEIVVVLSRRAEPYREAALLAGCACAALALAFILYRPQEFSVHGILPDVVIAGALGAWGASRWPRVLRRFTSERRRHDAVERADRVAFMEHAVGATRERTGVLVHYSALEEHLRILPDLAIQGKVPGARFNEIVAEFHRTRSADGVATALARAIRAIGPAVGAEFPHAGHDANELPDRPRVEDE